MEIKCKYPRIIRNPQFNNLVLSGYRHLNLNGYQKYITEDEINQMMEDGFLKCECLKIILGYKLKHEFSPSPTLPQFCSNYQALSKEEKRYYTPIYSINPEELDNFIMINDMTGEFVRVFMLTRCGHCCLCDESRVNNMQYRCVLEASTHPNPPMFLTFTYDNKNYPEDDKDLKGITRELQLFHKRLRKYLFKSGQETNFKYFIVSEYGKLRKRLHFHALYFGLHNCNYVPILNEWSDKEQFKYIYRFNDICRLIKQCLNIRRRNCKVKLIIFRF